MAKNSLKIAKKASFYPKTPPKVAQNRFQGGSGHLSGLKLCRTQKKWSGTSEGGGGGGGFINGPILFPPSEGYFTTFTPLQGHNPGKVNV